MNNNKYNKVIWLLKFSYGSSALAISWACQLNFSTALFMMYCAKKGFKKTLNYRS